MSIYVPYGCIKEVFGSVGRTRGLRRPPDVIGSLVQFRSTFCAPGLGL